MNLRHAAGLSAMLIAGGVFSETAKAQSVVLYSPPVAVAPVVVPAAVPVTAYRPYVPAPVVNYRPAVTALSPGVFPPVTAYSPVVPAVSTLPVTAYSPAVAPVVAYSPLAAAPPVTAYAPVVAYSPAIPAIPVGVPAVGVTPVVARTTYYVPGQPIRNFLRAITP